MKKLLINIIGFYQNFLSFDKGVLIFFAPGGACKYQVRCSEYTKQMIQKHGALIGAQMGIKRLWSCK